MAGPAPSVCALRAPQVARCTKIINPNTDDAKYVINVKQIAKFVVGLGDRVAPADIEEGMRVGVDRNKYQIQIPLPPKIDPTVTMMTVEEKPDITYNDIGGNKDEIQKLREVLELPMLHPERFVQLGIDPPKGILLYGPPGAPSPSLLQPSAHAHLTHMVHICCAFRAHEDASTVQTLYQFHHTWVQARARR